MTLGENKQRILVTGAAKGIGRAIALLLHNRGYRVTGTYYPGDKNDDKIEGIVYVSLDFNSEESIENCIQQVGDVDILVNNVGRSQIGPVEELSLEKIREDFQVNLFGMIQLTQAFLPGMRERKRGAVINIGSMAGKFPVPFQSVYVAAKSAVNGFSCSLRSEVAGYGIKVVVVEPSDIKTDIQPAICTEENSDYRDCVTKMMAAREKRMSGAPGPEIIARKIVKILKKKNPRPVYVVGGLGPLLVFLKRFFPDRVIEHLIRKNYDLN